MVNGENAFDCINLNAPYLSVMKQPQKPKSIKEWLSLESQFNLLSVSWLGPIVTTLLGLLLLLISFLIVLLFIDLFLAATHSGPYAQDVDGSAIRNIGLVLVALFGAPFLVWRSIVAAKLAKTSDDSLFNEKITSFANQLAARRQTTRVVSEGIEEKILTEWEDDLVARAIAIDGLEGLAQERPSIAPRIVRLIASYVRGTFPCPNLTPTDELTMRATPRMDLQKSIDLIGRVLIQAVKIDTANWRLDLTDCNFDGVNFSDGFFRAVNFTGSRMETAVLARGNFEGAIFAQCLMNYTVAFMANFRGSKFANIILSRPEPLAGGMSDSINMGNLEGASFIGADISAIDYLGEPNEIQKTFGCLETKVSFAVAENMPSYETHRRGFSLIRRVTRGRSITESQSRIIQELKATGFQNWPPYNAHDMALGYHHEQFLKSLNMYHWPFNSL